MVLQNIAMMDEQKPMDILIPKTKKHFSSMGHKIDTGKLRDMLREVINIFHRHYFAIA